MQKLFNFGAGFVGIFFGEAFYSHLFLSEERYAAIDEEVEESFYRIHGEPKHLPF